MKKFLAIGIILLFLFCNISFTTLSDENSGNLSGKTLYVGGSGPGNYTKIQDAIDDASDGDTVFVYNGTYYEKLLINTSITLQGEDANSTIIEGEITVFSGNTNICYFSIRNRGLYGEAIILRGHRDAKFCNISNNIVSNSNVGIHCAEFCNNIIIMNNKIFNNNCGVLLWASSSITVSNNNISNNERGIEFDLYSINNLIKNNNIISNEMGIGCYSLFNRISFNNLIDNSVNAHICTRIYIVSFIIPYPLIGRPNLWYKNYWDDWVGIGPKIIKGEFLWGFFFPIELIGFPIPIRSYDWNPAQEPYDIQVPEV